MQDRHQVWAGVDVAKAHVDVGFEDGKVRRFPNTEAGIARALAWCQEQGAARLVAEATGGYEQTARDHERRRRDRCPWDPAMA